MVNTTLLRKEEGGGGGKNNLVYFRVKFLNFICLHSLFCIYF